MNKNLILVAEDDVDDRFLLQTAFEESGAELQLQFVENGVDLLDFLNTAVAEKTPLPELILLDLNMPKKNGKETLAELKTHRVFKAIPVIVYTTTRNENEIRHCYELGANTYIVKPVTYEGLRKVVESITTYWTATASIHA